MGLLKKVGKAFKKAAPFILPVAGMAFGGPLGGMLGGGAAGGAAGRILGAGLGGVLSNKIGKKKGSREASNASQQPAVYNNEDTYLGEQESNRVRALQKVAAGRNRSNRQRVRGGLFGDSQTLGA